MLFRSAAKLAATGVPAGRASGNPSGSTANGASQLKGLALAMQANREKHAARNSQN